MRTIYGNTGTVYGTDHFCQLALGAIHKEALLSLYTHNL